MIHKTVRALPRLLAYLSLADYIFTVVTEKTEVRYCDMISFLFLYILVNTTDVGHDNAQGINY